MLPPADINGVVKQIYARSPVSTWVWGISNDCKDPVAAIRMMDFWFTEVGYMLKSYGIEGEHYVMEDGKPVHLDIVYSHPGGLPNFLRSLGASDFPSKPHDDIEAELAGMNEISRAGFTLYYESGVCTVPFPVLSFTEAEQAILDRYMPNFDTFFSEYEQQILLGDRDVDATWDAYIAEARTMGVFEVINVYQAAYDRRIASGQ
jgi:putative aldouronate transport system substrate-binding protein